MKKILFVVICLAATFAAHGQCFTMVAGKDVSAEGRIILAHNEDDSAVVPPKSTFVPAANGNLGYFRIQLEGFNAADSFINDHNVCVVSNRCRSKEEEMKEGGVVIEVRLEIAKKARTAREAVEIAGAFVEEKGYRTNGRSYIIADPQEAWVLSFVGGRHWLAQRIPDDKVFIIPNNFVITTFDLKDKDNFMGSADLVDYAVSKGWYNPAGHKPFSFKDVFGSPQTYLSDRNVLRHKLAIERLTGKKYGDNPDEYKLFVTPSKKVTKDDMIELLKSSPICVPATNYSVVFELDASNPITWLCYTRPDSGDFYKICK